MYRTKLHLALLVIAALVLLLPQSAVAAPPPPVAGPAGPTGGFSYLDDPVPNVTASRADHDEDELADLPLERDSWFYSVRVAGDPATDPTVAKAAVLRQAAANWVLSPQAKAAAALGQPQAAWSNIGPDPIVQQGRSPGFPWLAMSGRVGALAIRSSAPYTMYLGAAQGGVWVSSTLTSQWTPLTDQLPSLAIGAIALAPSDEDVVYVGTGEGALSGDSYFGNGMMKSTDGGRTFQHVGGNIFTQVSMSKIVVDPNDPDHVYVTVLRGRGGIRRVSPPGSTPFGIWESTDGGDTWIPRLTTNDPTLGATDLVMDPLNPQVLLASLWSTGILKSTDGGVTWHASMQGLPANADYAALQTRFSLGISHPVTTTPAAVYTGFEYVDSVTGNRVPSSIWKSTDAGDHWAPTSTAVIGDFCGTQCWYDNVMGVDPTDANIVYALGLFDYDTGLGGIFRSMDGGANWVDLGSRLHPDYHAIAIRRDSPSHIVIGNDGGVWSSANYGGRLNPNDGPDAVDWANLNGTVNPTTLAVTARTGLAIAQFTSIDQNPANVNRVYGGTQDNGTLRKSSGGNQWFDWSSGDGGQVIVDPTNPAYVFGTYYGISPYRFSEGMLTQPFSNQAIVTGIDRTDRSEFYIPWVMDPWFTNRLYLGTYRVYRTDDRGTQWAPISGDLTSGCTGPAPNGGRGCVISAFGTTAGGGGLYVGTIDSLVWVTPDATVSNPTWMRVDKAPLPPRPVQSIAVDGSNYRTAYMTYGGFNAFSPQLPGHVFKTTDGGATWSDISSNLPDVPVNSILIDPSAPDTLYIGTDVGPMVTTDGGAGWQLLGTGFPVVAIDQLNLNPFQALLRAGTHGRGGWSISTGVTAPALRVRKFDTGIPVGPGALMTYTITVQNWGNAAANNVAIMDPIPAHTTFVSADNGGSLNAGIVEWNVVSVTVPALAPGAAGSSYGGILPGSVSVQVTVRIDGDQTPGGTITNDGVTVDSAEGAQATGSPQVVTLAQPYQLALSPTSLFDGARSGTPVTYTLTIKNLGFNADRYNLSAADNQWPTTFWDAGFTQQISTTAVTPPGFTTTFGVRVTIPVTATNGMTDTVNVKATSVGDPAQSQSAQIVSAAVTVDILVVDDDDNGPNVLPAYTAALDAGHFTYDVYDVRAKKVLPLNYLKAHKAVVWFTGAAYPGPITPYEPQLTSFLNDGGRLFMSGMDILDQAAGTTAFVQDYLHIAWDGTERQNDTGTLSVTAVTSNTVTNGMGTIPMDYTVFDLTDFSDQITPIAPAGPAFLDDAGEPDALTVTVPPPAQPAPASEYKVMFLAFPFEAMGTPVNQADLMTRAMLFFDINAKQLQYMPVIRR